jgi:phosphohistidine phosphatase SixA
MLLVVRHADAGDKRTWKGPDSLRPLSPTGHHQAEGLIVRLEDYPVERILCSPPSAAIRRSSRSRVTACCRLNLFPPSGWTPVPRSC